MDFEHIKAEIKEIAQIAQSVPDQFRDRCFELLLSHLLRDGSETGEETKGNTRKPATLSSKQHQPNRTNRGEGAASALPTPSQVRLLMARTNVTEEDLRKILLTEGDDVQFIREPHQKGIAAGQIEWSLLLSLKNGILNNTFSVDPEDVRSLCQDKGYYDKGNFARTFKKPGNAKLFKKALVPQGPAEQLSSDGILALGALIKRLAGGQSEN